MRNAVIVILALGAALLAGPAALAAEEAGRWDPAGTEIGTSRFGTWACSYVPLNPERDAYFYTCQGVWDPTLGGAFPVASATDFVGQCDRTGPASFRCLQLSYGATAAREIILKYVAYAALERQPDGTMIGKIDACLFAGSQDPFAGEFPAYGCNYGEWGLWTQTRLVVSEAPTK